MRRIFFTSLGVLLFSGQLAECSDAVYPGPADSAGEYAKNTEIKQTRLRLATMSDSFDPRLMLPLATASKYGLSISLIGLGKPVTWGAGLGKKLNAEREFIYTQTDPDDVVVIFDAYDVEFQGGEKEILSAFLTFESRTGRHVVYNSEPWCSLTRRKSEYPPCSSVWCYLNSGVLLGRSWALREVYENEIAGDKLLEPDGKPLRAQNWHTYRFLDLQHLIELDRQGELVQTIFGIPGLLGEEDPNLATYPPDSLKLEIRAGKVINTGTNATAPILHFPGPGHWPHRGHYRPGTCYSYEVMRLQNPDLLELMEAKSMSSWPGSNFGIPPWKQVCGYVTGVDAMQAGITHKLDTLMRYFNLYPAPMMVAFIFLNSAMFMLFLRRSGRSGGVFSKGKTT